MASALVSIHNKTHNQCLLTQSDNNLR